MRARRDGAISRFGKDVWIGEMNHCLRGAGQAVEIDVLVAYCAIISRRVLTKPLGIWKV
jgi:hypothetical protein